MSDYNGQVFLMEQNFYHIDQFLDYAAQSFMTGVNIGGVARVCIIIDIKKNLIIR